jgi:uncharacterized protein (TIGR02145 family)
MKKIPVLFFFIFILFHGRAQDFRIAFEGTGDTLAIERIYVYNQNSGLSTILNGGDTLHLIQGKSAFQIDSAVVVDMPYTVGNQLLIHGISGKYSTYLTMVPSKSDTISIPFTTCTDRDNNNYSIVLIGTQVWMAENLRSTLFRDGTEIPRITGNADWANLTSSGYCWYNNDPGNKSTYGALYNWYAVSSGKIAPDGWHVPTNAEWTTLINFLGGVGKAGGRMKATGTLENATGLWNEPNFGASDSCGFAALPGGYRHFGGGFNFINENAFFWTSTKAVGQNANSPMLYYDSRKIYQGLSLYNYGFSVRCVKGFAVGLDEPGDPAGLHMYPNPASDYFFIESDRSGNSHLAIYNLVGNRVFQKECNDQDCKVDISSLPKGLYVVELHTPQGKIYKKLLKQ